MRDELNQQTLDEMHAQMLEFMSQYRSGIMMLDEFLREMGALGGSYAHFELTGLTDPATGLKYHGDVRDYVRT